MYAYQLTGPNQGRYVEVDRPNPKPDELLIRVHRVGICGTDIEMLRGTMPYFSLQATRQGGTISVVGIYERPLEKLDMGMAVVRDLTLCCSVASPNSFEQTLRLMAAGKIQAKPLVTHVLDLPEAPRAFELQQTRPDRRIKIHLRPPAGE